MNTRTLPLFLLFAISFTFCSDPQSSDKVSPSNEAGSYASFDALSNATGGISVTPSWKGEGYNEVEENPFINVADEPISTFSIDADGASYSNTRRFLKENHLPPKAAIRTEELINYFNYDYPEADAHPIGLNGEIADCPWTQGNKLLRIGLRGEDIPEYLLPASNFVFLIDVSGSMSAPNKLELLKKSFNLFVDYLDDRDKISIVTYAGMAGVVLPPTPGDKKSEIKAAINQLGAGGSTAGAQGIITAYELAQQNFIPNGNNRVILGSDGDFNVGISNQEELVELIEEKRELGIFLTILGVGTGNLQDGKMEQIANNGNGNYEYIDNLEQAKKVFIYEFNKFYTVAKDVKIQIQFNENMVKAYRLIGYENRLLEKPEDFEDDTKDAGEIGSNQTITALYELVPSNQGSRSSAAMTIKFRYKKPDEDISIPIELDVFDENLRFSQSSENMRFAAAAAGFGMMLGESQYKGNLTYEDIIRWARRASNYDPFGFRQEFITLVNVAKEL